MASFGKSGAYETLALHIARGVSIKDAAAAAKIKERTAYRRASEPAFRRRVNEIRRRALDQGIGWLCDGLIEAVQVVRDLIHNGKSEATRLAAARAYADMLVHLRAHADFDERLLKLEQAAPPDREPAHAESERTA